MYSSLLITTCLFAALATTLAVQSFPQIGGGNDFMNLIDQVETADEPMVLSTSPPDFGEFGSGSTNIPATFVDFGQLISSVDTQDSFDVTTFQTFQNLNTDANFPLGDSGTDFSLCLVLFSSCVGICPAGGTCGSDGSECTCLPTTPPSPPPPPTPPIY